jgi:sulfoxide reductase catalytic subunit YedY
MLIRTRTTADVSSSEITPEGVYLNRRSFMRRAALATGAVLASGGITSLLGACESEGARAETRESGGEVMPADELTPYEDVTTYNNFYEFGTDKSEPAQNAKGFVTRPWTVKVDGLVAKPADYALEDFVKPMKLEERVYRLRCVEGWSMVIPWLGFPLAEVLKRAQPLASARYVEMTTLHDPRRMPGQRRGVLDWPYREGLRLDEAMHPLTILATGLYGKTLPNQNGAPLRLVVPWKYGFKSIKSIVRLRLTDQQPRTAWNDAAPDEYGFYANVNPTVDHPRWSQARERRVGEIRKRDTLMFNGYGDQVARLYAGMDLRRLY